MVLRVRLIIIAACVIGAWAGGAAQGAIAPVFRAVRLFVRPVRWPEAYIRPDSRLSIAEMDHVPRRGARSPHVVAVPSGVLWHDIPLLLVGRESSEPCVKLPGPLPRHRPQLPRDHHGSTPRGFNLRSVAAHVCRVLYSVAWPHTTDICPQGSLAHGTSPPPPPCRWCAAVRKKLVLR